MRILDEFNPGKTQYVEREVLIFGKKSMFDQIGFHFFTPLLLILI